MKETLTRFRETGITDYVRLLMDYQSEVRKGAIKDPPAIIVGDRQAVRALASFLHDQKVKEEIRIDLATAIAVIAEKPREASGGGKHKEGERLVRSHTPRPIHAIKYARMKQ